MKNYKENQFWLHSATFDIGIFVFTLILSFLFVFIVDILSLYNSTFPLWAFIGIVVAFDVSHVYGTLYRVYMDPSELNRKPRLYYNSIIIIYIISVIIYAVNPKLFFSAIAYYAVYHFIKQNYGLVAIYKHKLSERSRFDFYLDKITIWNTGLYPIIWWHCHLPREFSWFIDGDFNYPVYLLLKAWNFIFYPVLGEFPNQAFIQLVDNLFVLYIAIFIIYIIRQIYLLYKNSYFNPGKNIAMFSVALTWYLGIIYFNNDIKWSAMIIIVHAIPYFAIVWIFTKEKHSDPNNLRQSRSLAFLSKPKNIVLFYLFLFAIGLIEEIIWDLAVWRDYIRGSSFWTKNTAREIKYLFWIPLLSLPQLVHYYLDSKIWIGGKENPEVDKYLYKKD